MREEYAKEVVEKMLDSSFQYLARNGLENFSIRELCKATGISMGSIYYWFDGKEKLINDVVEFGLNKAANSIFDQAVKYVDNFDLFFDNSIDMISGYKTELKLIYQVATSPVYGEYLRDKALALNNMCGSYAEKLADKIGCSANALMPIVYMLISVLLDYAIWENIEKTKIQISALKTLFKDKCNK